MKATDFTEFHALVEQFSGEMTLAEICRQEHVDYRRYIYWRKRNGHSRPRRDHAPEGIVEMEVTDMPSPASRRSAGRATLAVGLANVRIEFENGLLFERRGMDVDLLAEFIDMIRPALCLS